MDDTNEPLDEYPYARPLLITQMPRTVTDETALQVYQLMKQLTEGFHSKYEVQIQRAQVERRRAIEEFRREQEVLMRKRQIRAAELDLPICGDNIEIGQPQDP